MRKFLSSECSIVVDHQFLMKTPKQVLTESTTYTDLRYSVGLQETVSLVDQL